MWQCGSTKFRVTVLDTDFVVAYIEYTRAKFQLMPFGAPKCPQLGRDLSRMAVLCQLERYATGIGGGLCFQGFPRWIYTYALRQHEPQADQV